MLEKMRRPLAVVAIVLGVVLALASAGPLSWGFGAVVGALVVVAGYAVLTDPRPEEIRRRGRVTR